MQMKYFECLKIVPSEVSKLFEQTEQQTSEIRVSAVPGNTPSHPKYALSSEHEMSISKWLIHCSPDPKITKNT